MSFDLSLFSAINGLAGQSKALDLLGIFLAHWLPYILIIILSALAFKNWKMALSALVSGGVASLIVKRIILFFIQRPRPYIVLPGAHKLISTTVAENFQSFPSGHALFFFALAMAVYFYHKKWGYSFFVCAAVMGIARVFVGVHWPSDILAGAILGIMVGYSISYAAKKYLHNYPFLSFFQDKKSGGV